MLAKNTIAFRRLAPSAKDHSQKRRPSRSFGCRDVIGSSQLGLLNERPISGDSRNVSGGSYAARMTPTTTLLWVIFLPHAPEGGLDVPFPASQRWISLLCRGSCVIAPALATHRCRPPFSPRGAGCSMRQPRQASSGLPGFGEYCHTDVNTGKYCNLCANLHTFSGLFPPGAEESSASSAYVVPRA